MNKYNAKPTVCNQGHRHASASESSRCDYLHLLVRAGEILHVDTQPVVDLPCGRYKPDFAVWWVKESAPVFEDVKGVITAEFRRIRKTCDATHPAAPLHVVKRKGKGWEEI